MELLSQIPAAARYPGFNAPVEPVTAPYSWIRLTITLFHRSVDFALCISGCDTVALRVRRLLMHKKEIVQLFSKTKQDGYSVIPLEIGRAHV